MMRTARLVLACVIVMQMGCASRGPLGDLGALSGIQRIALVSLVVEDYDGTVRSGAVGGADVSLLLQEAANRMLDDTEALLSEHYRVVWASGFVDNDVYREKAVATPRKLVVPQVNTMPLGVFAEKETALKYGDISAEKAQALCEALGVDGIFLAYSEWTVRIGGWVPLTKAYTRNYLAMWDAHGQKVYFRHIDKMGNRTLGAWGVNAMIPETIEQWTGSYRQSLELMLQ